MSGRREATPTHLSSRGRCISVPDDVFRARPLLAATSTLLFPCLPASYISFADRRRSVGQISPLTPYGSDPDKRERPHIHQRRSCRVRDTDSVVNGRSRRTYIFQSRQGA